MWLLIHAEIEVKLFLVIGAHVSVLYKMKH